MIDCVEREGVSLLDRQYSSQWKEGLADFSYVDVTKEADESFLMPVCMRRRCSVLEDAGNLSSPRTKGTYYLTTTPNTSPPQKTH